MNVRPGDLAMVVRSAAGNEEGDGMSTHTQGRWFYVKCAETIRIRRQSDETEIARIVLNFVADNARKEADARLISAAPELLRELERMVSIFMERQPAKGLDGEAQEFIDSARAAISKARNA